MPLLFVIPLLFATYCLPAQSTTPLSIDQIMRGEYYTGFSPEEVRWTFNGDRILFSWNPDLGNSRKTYVVDINKLSAAPEPAASADIWQEFSAGHYNHDRSKLVYAKFGDLFIRDLRNNQDVQISQTVEEESNPIFSADGRQLIFRRADNLYALTPETGALRQLTNISREADGGAESSSHSAARSWLQDDQMQLFEVLRLREAREDSLTKAREALKPPRPKSFRYRNQRLDYVVGSPDMQFFSWRLSSSNSGGNRTRVAEYVNSSGYADILNTRPKVGTQEESYQLYLYHVGKDTIFQPDLKGLPGIYDKPAFLATYHLGDSSWQQQYEQPRPVIFHGPFWNADGSRAALVIRSLDNKDRWIVSLDTANFALTLIDHQHDEAWIGGPGIEGWLNAAGTIGWLPDGRHLYFQSEKSGYSHLYLADLASGETRQLTRGPWEVLEVTLNLRGDTFYLTANAEGPHEQHFYHLPALGGSLTRITQGTGAHQVVLSPDQTKLAIRYSNSNTPWELYVQDNKPGASARKLTSSQTASFSTYSWRKPEIVNFTARDGASVPARLYRPKRPQRGGPAVIFVHGAGYLQNVHQWWSTYYREYMFHNLLADQGYTVLDIDYRASAGYGRDWRTAIYRHMGGKDLSDHVDGAKFLADQYGVDPKRIGIYGGSYGGFITLMALFTEPNTFACGAALRAVTDWAHYNHPYTANILNTPVQDSLAYRRSSPIYHAEGLSKPLLILHGMVDVNVHYQDVVRLAQRLIELGKDQWEMAVYPVEDHGFIESSSWADEYKRIFRLFEQHLRQSKR